MKTVIGKLSRNEGTSKAHHGTFDQDDVKMMREKVNWRDREPFHVIPMFYRLLLISVYSYLKPFQLKITEFLHVLQRDADASRAWRTTGEEMEFHTVQFPLQVSTGGCRV